MSRSLTLFALFVACFVTRALATVTHASPPTAQDARVTGKLRFLRGVPERALEFLVLPNATCETSGAWYDAMETRSDEVRSVRIEPGAFEFRIDALPATIWLEHSTHYLEQPVVASDSSRTYVRPKLGGSLTLRFLPPPDARPDAALEGLVVELTGKPFPHSFGALPMQHFESNRIEHRLVLDASGTAHIDGLDPERRWRFVTRPEGWIIASEWDCGVRRGEDVEHTIQLRIGTTLSGRVIDTAGKPVVGADVSWAPTDELLVYEPRATTDQSGAFTLTGVEPGAGRVFARHAGFLPGELDDVLAPETGALADLLVTLDRRPPIRGLLIQPNGSPIPQGTVVLSVSPELPRFSSFSGTPLPPDRETTCDEFGRFTFEQLAYEEYELSGRWRSGDGTEWRAERISVRPSTEPVVLEAEPLAGLRVRLIDEHGEPVRDRYLEAHLDCDDPDIPTTRLSCASADADGVYSFPEAPLGTYWIDLANRDRVLDCESATCTEWSCTVESGPEVTELRVLRPARVSGQVLDPYGEPVREALVLLWLRDSDSEDDGGRIWTRATTNADGTFELYRLHPKTYWIQVTHDDWVQFAPLQRSFAAGQVVNDLEIDLSVGNTIHGVVYDLGGTPSRGHKVRLIDTETGEASKSDRTDDEGAYSLTAVAAGTYRLQLEARADRRDAWSRRVEDASRVEDSSLLVEVADGESLRVDFGEPGPRARRITGRVVTEHGPVSGGRIQVYSARDFLAPLLASAIVDRNGEFTLDLVSRNSVIVGYSRDLLRDSGMRRRATLPSTDDTAWTFEVPRGSVGGRVVDESGAPVPGARVRLRGPDSDLAATSRVGTTDERGRYRFEHVEDGSYTILANGPSVAETPKAAPLLHDVVVEDSSRVAVPEARLTTLIVVQGTVLDEDDAPVEGCEVFARGADGDLLSLGRPAITDVEGRFRLEVLPERPVRLEARNADVACRAVEVAPDEPVVLRARSACLLRLRAVDAAGMPTDATFVVLDEEGRALGDHWLRRAGSEAEPRTGRLDVGPVPHGEYVVRATNTAGEQLERRLRLKLLSRRTLTFRFDSN